jgi:hypothetical protein
VAVAQLTITTWIVTDGLLTSFGLAGRRFEAALMKRSRIDRHSSASIAVHLSEKGHCRRFIPPQRATSGLRV